MGVAGDDAIKARKRCAAVVGKIRACNAQYGQNGWLGEELQACRRGDISSTEHGRAEVYLRNLSHGRKLITHVFLLREQ